jgi:K+-sensing histidine kinase KdpD
MRWAKYAAAAGTVVAVVLVLRLASVEDAGISAPLLLLDVIVVARVWGLPAALIVATLAAAAHAYYFLPPAGFEIAAPEDWIAFITFIVTAVVAGELSSRAERRAAEAQAGRREIERLYQELQAAFDRASEIEAARRNEQLKAALLDALTHNLRTPLTAIKAAVTALIGSRNGSTDLSIESRRELLQVIDEESDRLNRFIEGLSAPASTETAQPINLRATRLDELVGKALMRAETVTRDHHVTVDLDDRLPMVSAEPAAVIEVIYMLLDNASKYSPDGSRIAVRAAVVDERFVQLTVSDQGPGIPPDMRERVFEKFFRIPLRESTDRRRSGIGLGLPIARRLVEAQAGRIWIDRPAVGGGTTVALTLPIASAREESDNEAAPIAAAR